MDHHNEEQKIDGILNSIYRLIESQPCEATQIIHFKDLITQVHSIQNKALLHTCYNNRGIDLISLICKQHKTEFLRYLLYESHVLHYFIADNKNIGTNREDIFYNAICSNQFDMIEMLYDHWTGDLHWLGHMKGYNNFDVDNLNQIHNMLEVSFERYEQWILSKEDKIIDQTMKFNVQSLMALSKFQSDLYSKLLKLKTNLRITDDDTGEKVRIKETHAICDMFVGMLSYYEKHTDRLKDLKNNSVYEIPDKYEDFNKFYGVRDPRNTGELLHKTWFYFLYEVYFRKLDYNICLLILDNLHSLKLRLKMAEDSYQTIENKIYHFIHHLSNGWNLYVLDRNNMETKIYSGRCNDIVCKFKVRYNPDAISRGLHIVYLERRDFESVLLNFKTELARTNVEDNIRENKTELPKDEVNSLTLLPELRDMYSLQRISRHITQIITQSIHFKLPKEHICLLVERTLQVVGEFLKSTNETLHLQPTTEALVEAEISVDVVSDLKALREILCHVKDGELLKRIDIETNDTIFVAICNELKFINEKIHEVISIYKALVDKALIKTGINLIEKRINEISSEAKNLLDAVKRVRLFPQHEPYGELFEAPAGFADKYGTEIIMLAEHSIQLESELVSVSENIRKNFKRKIFMYEQSICDSVKKICEVKKNWQEIVTYLKNEINITLSEQPNENDANRIKSCSKQVVLRNDLNRLVEDNKLFAYAEIHWKFVRKLLEFIILRTEINELTPAELQEFKTLSYNNDDMENIVGNYLLIHKEKSNVDPNMKYENRSPEFKCIKMLKDKLTKKNFLIQDEKKYLIDTLNKLKNKSKSKRKNKIEMIIDKITKDTAIPKTECTNFISTVNLDEKAQKILMNLVMGYKRDPLHLWCLSRRIALLREIITGQSEHQLVARYKLDTVFGVLLEVLVFDIFALLECTKNNEIVKKSSKLLTDINLRNFLIHGSPLLEIVGTVLDSNDLPLELISKALELLKEEKSINALCTLKDLGFDFTQINSDALSVAQCTLVNEFKKSPRWKDYLIFIPKEIYKKEKKVSEVNKNLLEAVKANDPKLVQKRIEEGGNVNFIDKFPLIHHAAIKGSVDVMEVLITNGANVNVPGNHNRTALHYSAMNGFIAKVDLLLKNGADCLAKDNQGLTPADVANQRKHDKVCQLLEEINENKAI